MMMEPYWEFVGTLRGMRLWETSRRLVGDKGEIRRLAPQQHELLLFFLEHQQELVKKAQLMNLLWHGHPNVSEHRLETLVSELRELFGRKEIIETTTRVGYRWLPIARRVDPANHCEPKNRAEELPHNVSFPGTGYSLHPWDDLIAVKISGFGFDDESTCWIKRRPL